MKKIIGLVLAIIIVSGNAYAFEIDSVVFKNGMVVITENEKYGLMDHEFQTIFAPTYDYLKYIDDEHIIFSEDGKYGIFNINRQPKVKPLYNDIIYMDNYFICQLDTGTGFKYDYVNMNYNIIRASTLISPSKERGFISTDSIAYIRENYNYRKNDRNKNDELEYFNTLLFNSQYFFDNDIEYNGLMEDPDEEYNFSIGIDNFGKMFKNDNRQVWMMEFSYGSKSNPEFIIANWPKDLNSMFANEGAIVCKNIFTEMVNYYTKDLDEAIDISDKVDYYHANIDKLDGSKVISYGNYNVAIIRTKNDKLKVQLLLRK